MRYKLSILPLFALITIFYFLYSGLNKDPTLIPSPLIGKKIPQFYSTALLEQKSISSEDLIGEPFILNVWASWCYACTLEHNNLLKIHKNNTIPIYGLNYKDDTDSAKEWLNSKGNPYKDIIVDVDGNIGIDFGVYGAPETFLVNNDGLIIHKHVGPIDESYYNKIILPLIENEN